MARTQINFLFITAICARGIPVPTTNERRKFFVKVQAGNVTRQTEVLKECSMSPSWSKNIHINALEASTIISFSLYRRKLVQNQCLGRCQAPLQDFASDRKEITLTLDCPTTQIVLTIHYESDICSAIKAVFPESAAVDSSGAAALYDVPSAQNLGSKILATSSTVMPILQSIDQFKRMFDELVKIHPFASAAWGLLNLAYNALKNQNNKDQSVVRLYQTMMAAYAAASEDDILKRHKEFKVVFDAMLVQTMECALFISEYASKPFIGRFFTVDAVGKINEFRDMFTNLEKQFHDREARKTAVVSLRTYSSVKFMEMKTTLGALNIIPPAPHRDSCLVGTRVEIIKKIWSWIGKCEPGVLWVHGLAGSGKSALASTIVEHARAMPGYNGRLGAFIRFDRNGINDRSRVITTLASKLAAFDDRIGTAITNVVRNCPDINEWPLSAQFTKLVIETLESTDELSREGPIIVIVDALDECGVLGKRADLLGILAQGFGENLPMMRLIIMSRPEEDIQQSFNPERKQHIITLPLAIGSESGQRDVRHYFDEKSREIQNNEFQRIWRDKDAAAILAHRANGHFIWAATAFEYIKEYPVRRLDEVLAAGESLGSSAEGNLDSLYHIALRSAVGARGNDIKADMLPLLGTLIVARGSLLVTTLSSLAYGSGKSMSSIILEKLGSLVSLEEGKPVELLHKSFDDFLIDQQRSGEWYISTDQANMEMAMRCQILVSKFLDDMQPQTVQADTILDDIVYACMFWLEHVSSLPRTNEKIDTQLRHFFQKHFLKWLEIMVLLNPEKFEVVDILQQLLEWTNGVQCEENDRNTRYGAYQFARRFAQDIEENPSLIYITALTFAPPNNIIRQYYSTEQPPKVTGNGSDRLLSLCPHYEYDVISVAFSPDGSKVASGSGSGAIYLWDAVTGMSINRLQNHDDRVFSVAFSPDGSKLVSGSADKTIRVWSVAAGELLRVLQGHEDRVHSVGFSPDGSTIVSGSSDHTIRLWDISSGELLLPPLYHGGSIHSVVFSPDGSRILSGSRYKTIRLWNATTGALLRQLDGHDDEVNSVAFSPDGSKIISASDDKTIRLWDAATGAPLLAPLQYSALVYSVTFSPNGSTIASASGDKTVRVLQSATGASLIEPLHHDGVVRSVAVSYDGSRIASGSFDGSLRVWDAAIIHPEPFQGHNSLISAISFSPDGTTLVSGSADKTIQIWDTDTGLSRFGPLRHGGEVTAVAFSPDGSNVVSGSIDSTIRIWSAATGRLLHDPLQGHTDAIRCITFSNDGSKIFSGSDDKTIRTWHAAMGNSILHPFIGHEDAVLSIALSPDGSRLVSGSADSMIRVWDIDMGTSVLGPLGGHRGPVTAVLFSLDGTQIISGSDDATILVWDNITGAPLMEPLQGHNDSITSFAFLSLDSSQRLISTSTDETVQLWDLSRTLQPSDSLDRKVVTKFPKGFIAKLVCVSEQTEKNYVAGVSRDSELPLHGCGIVVIEVSPLIG